MNKRTYSLSFTAVSLRLHDFLRVAREFEGCEGSVTIKHGQAAQILGKGHQRSSQREMSEFVKRYNALTLCQRQLLLDGTLDEQKNVTFLAIVKCYEFILDFMVEVIRDKFLVFDFQVHDSEFRSFYNRKMELHPELESFAESTIDKARQTVFKMMADAGIIDDTKSKHIRQPWLSPQFIQVVSKDNKELLKAFLLTDKDINKVLDDVQGRYCG